MAKGKVLLSFDVEEFDLPREHGTEISLEEGVKVSSGGLERILVVLKENDVRATFFVTGNFALKRPDLIKRMKNEGHEIACHGVDHFNPKSSDMRESKEIVEKVAGVTVQGYRQPRMGKINYKKLADCGYKYDSSINPTLIPGRYNNLSVSRMPFMREDVIEIPTSVAMAIRIPVFWLALHLLPVSVYMRLAKLAIKKTGFFATYFHPWEFSQELKNYKKIPGYIKRRSGKELVVRLDSVINELKKSGYEFLTYGEFTKDV